MMGFSLIWDFYLSIVSFRDGALKVAGGNFLFLATFDFWQFLPFLPFNSFLS